MKRLCRLDDEDIQDIARAVAFLAGPSAAYITGAVVPDRGRVRFDVQPLNARAHPFAPSRTMATAPSGR